jgi:hypothetical protein
MFSHIKTLVYEILLDVHGEAEQAFVLNLTYNGRCFSVLSLSFA